MGDDSVEKSDRFLSRMLLGMLNTKGHKRQSRPLRAAIILVDVLSQLRLSCPSRPRSCLSHGVSTDEPPLRYRRFYVNAASRLSIPECLVSFIG